MSETYKAILQGNQIEWSGGIPAQANSNEKINVFITIPDEATPASNGRSLSLNDGEEALFQQLTEQWRNETQYFSSLPKMVLHPAYQKIIGLGKPAVPLILAELEVRPDHWLWALHAITGEDPAPSNATLMEAVRAWLDWGRLNGYLR